MQGKITKTSVDRLEPWTVLWDSEVKGFGVRRHGADARHYLLRYRFAGKQTFRKIGRHGSPFTPDTARNEAIRREPRRAASATLGNLSEPAGDRSDCRHLLEASRKKKASRALARTATRLILLYRPSLYSAYSGARSFRDKHHTLLLS
jgi:hypothetical protein